MYRFGNDGLWDFLLHHIELIDAMIQADDDGKFCLDLSLLQQPLPLGLVPLGLPLLHEGPHVAVVALGDPLDRLRVAAPRLCHLVYLVHHPPDRCPHGRVSADDKLPPLNLQLAPEPFDGVEVGAGWRHQQPIAAVLLTELGDFVGMVGSVVVLSKGKKILVI